MADTFRILTEVLVDIQNQESLDGLAKNIDTVTKKNAALNDTQKALKEQIAATDDAAKKGVLNRELNRVEAAIKKNTAAAKELGGEVGKMSLSFTKIAEFAAGSIAAGGLQSIADAAINQAKAIVDAGGRFEQYKIQLNTLFKSADVGKKVFEDLQQAAKETPFSFSELIDLTGRLAAAQINDFEIIPIIESLGDIAAGVGKEKLPQLVLAFTQVKTAGRLTGNELKQFSEAGIPLIDLLAKSMDKSTAEIRDLGKSKVTFDDVKKALESATNSGGQFFDLMKKQSQTTLGAFSNFGDAVEQLRASIGSQNNGIIKDLTVFVTGLVNATKEYIDGDLVQKIQAEQAALTGLVGAIGFVENATLGLNEKNKIRSSLLADLRAQYPSFLGNLKDEQITTEALNALLESNNKLYSEKLRIARQDIIVQGANKELADAELSLTKRLISINELVAEYNQITGESLIVNNIEQANAALSAIERRAYRNLSGIELSKIPQLDDIAIKLKGKIDPYLFGESVEDLQKQVEDKSKQLSGFLKAQSQDNIRVEQERKNRLLQIDKEIALERQVLAGNIDKDDQKEIKNKIAILELQKKQLTEAISPTPTRASAPKPIDLDAQKDAEKAAKKRLEIQQKAREDLVSEIEKLNDDIARLNNEQGQVTEAQILKNNDIEREAARRGFIKKMDELKKEGALTKGLRAQFEEALSLVDLKFTTKGDIEIKDLREKIAKLKSEIQAELDSLASGANIDRLELKYKLVPQTDALAAAEGLSSQLELINAKTNERLITLQKDFAAKIAKIKDDQYLDAKAKEAAITNLTEIEVIKRDSILLESEASSEEARIAYYERLVELAKDSNAKMLRLVDDQTAQELSALGGRYLQGLISLEEYEKQKSKIQKTANVRAANTAVESAEKDLQVLIEYLGKLKNLRDTAVLDKADGKITDASSIDESIRKTNEEIEELQSNLIKLKQAKVDASVEVKVDTKTNTDKLQKALSDPISAAIKAVMPKISDEATGLLKDALSEAFSLGSDIAKDMEEERQRRADAEIERLQKSVEYQRSLKDANTERIEAELQQIDRLQQRKDAAAQKAIVANNLERISALALAVAQAVLAINKTAAVSNVAAPIVIPLVVGAIALGVASTVALAGSAEQGDVDISPTGNRRKRGSTDNLLYAVGSGESVITRKGTARNKELLTRINAGEAFNVVSPNTVKPLGIAAVSNSSIQNIAAGGNATYFLEQKISQQIAVEVGAMVAKAVAPIEEAVKLAGENSAELLAGIGGLQKRMVGLFEDVKHDFTKSRNR